MNQADQPTYTVTIRAESNQWVARDNDGHWRCKGDRFDAFAPREHGRKLAEYLFHADEIANVKIGDDGKSTIAEIYGA